MNSRNSRLAQGSLWFLSLQSKNIPPAEGGLRSPAAAFKAFCKLLGIDLEDRIADNPLSSTDETNLFDIQRLLDGLKDLKKKVDKQEKKGDKKSISVPILVLGTFSEEEVVRHSWCELGLNLFDLPWFSATEDKIFKYIPLLSPFEPLYNLKKLLTSFIDLDKYQYPLKRVINQLGWAQCHKFSLKVQKAVGHGIRDLFQTTYSWENICSSLDKVITKEESSLLPCGRECRLRKQINELLDFSSNDEQQRLSLAQKVAGLECRAYRLAPTKYFVTIPEFEKPRFKRIVLIDDNKEFRKVLEKELGRFIDKEEKVKPKTAHLAKSLQCRYLSDGKGKDIIKDWHEKEKIEYEQILACFDLNLEQKNTSASEVRNPLADIFGGYWLVYRTACVYPNVPRMVITGFRSQDILSYAAGGNAYLLKPFTRSTMDNQIKKVSVLHRVKWLCPKAIQEDYSNLLKDSVFFKDCVSFLTHWLGKKRIELKIIEAIGDETVESDLIVVDIFRTQSKELATEPFVDLVGTIAKIRYINNLVPLLVVIPNDVNVEDLVPEYYHKLPLALRDGYDAVIKKPMWMVANECLDSEDGLGNMIISQLTPPSFDVKYQVLVPVAAVIGRFDGKFVSLIQKLKKPPKDPVKFYAPLIPFLIKFYGLSARLEDIANPEHQDQLIDYLIKYLSPNERKKEPDRWKNIKDLKNTEIKKIASAFAKAFAEKFKKKSIPKYLTLEAWLREMVDYAARKASQKNKQATADNNTKTTKNVPLPVNQKDLDTLIEPLTRVFGGVTKYEFTVQGAWYNDENKLVDDILIVIEFCAKSSIMAKKFIEQTIVRYLLTIAKEECVLVQEIPIRGFLQ